MGNQPPNRTRSNSIRRYGGTGGNGFNRPEFDDTCKPSGLYKSCEWDDRTVRRLIGDGKIAARLVGTDDLGSCSDQECPICFLNYSEINMLNCCKATICTECYLQVQCPKTRSNPCPFCNQPKMSIVIAKKMDVDEMKQRDEEEQKRIEATIKARLNGEKESPSQAPTPSSSFGSNLEQEMRSRTRSMSSDIHEEMGIVAMSPEERRALEEEMRSQSSHPLLRQMTSEAEQERERHELEHFERTRERVQSSRNQLTAVIRRLQRGEDLPVSLFTGSLQDENNGAPAHQRERSPINEMMMLETALYLSMNAQGHSSTRRGFRERLSTSQGGRLQVSTNPSSNDRRNLSEMEYSMRSMFLGGMSEQAQLEMAIQMSLEEASRQIQESEETNSSSETD